MRTIRPSILGKLFGIAQYKKFQIRPEGLLIVTKADSTFISFSDLQKIKLNSGLIWRELKFSLKDKKQILINLELYPGNSRISPYIVSLQ